MAGRDVRPERRARDVRATFTRVAHLWALPTGFALALAGCSANPLPQGGVSVSHPIGDGKCKAEPIQRFVGVRATDALGIDILDASGAQQLRWGGPDTAFTMDYREDRVNVIYDASGLIEKVTCG